MIYRPELSIRENATINSLSEASIRKYLRLNKIDRRYETNMRLFLLVKKVQQIHPDWSARRIARELKISQTTVSKYQKLDSLNLSIGKNTLIETVYNNTYTNFDKFEEYPGCSVKLIAFSKKDYFFNGHSIGLGNMETFPIEFMGHIFNSPEHAYIACSYGLNNKNCIKVQREIQASTNALKCKRQYRNTSIAEEIGRKDFHRSHWHLHLMLYLVWLKCLKYPDFRDRLLAIPDDTVIIENQSRMNKIKLGDWGCKNDDAKYAYYRKLDELKACGTRSRIECEESATIQSWNIGIWRGFNYQGKILMSCRHALRKGIAPQIDTQALNNAKIYLFGKRLVFSEPLPFVGLIVNNDNDIRNTNVECHFT